MLLATINRASVESNILPSRTFKHDNGHDHDWTSMRDCLTDSNESWNARQDHSWAASWMQTFGDMARLLPPVQDSYRYFSRSNRTPMDSISIPIRDSFGRAMGFHPTSQSFSRMGVFPPIWSQKVGFRCPDFCGRRMHLFSSVHLLEDFPV